MNDTIFNFPGYSMAAKAYDVLKQQHIQATIVRTSAGENGQCGYSVRVNANDAMLARNIITANNLYYIHLNRFKS